MAKLKSTKCVLFGLPVLVLTCMLFYTKHGFIERTSTGQKARYSYYNVMKGSTETKAIETSSSGVVDEVDRLERIMASNGSGQAGTACDCRCGRVTSSHPGPPPDTLPVNRNHTPAAEAGEAAARSKGVNVLVLTSMRTGSSFIGEMFGRNEDIFYLFEPGLALLTELIHRRAVFIQSLYLDMLKALYGCDTTDLDFYIRWLVRQFPQEVKKKVPRVFDSICYELDASTHSFKCNVTTHDIFMKICREKRNIAIKSIRVQDIGMLEPMITDSSVNLKVIHLVRDPRGMTASRVQAMNAVKNTHNKLEAKSFTDEMRQYLLEYCSYSVDNKEAGYYLPKYRDNYYLLRYEDMSLDPHGTAKSIYNFTGLGAVPETVSKWIAENTQTHQPGVYSTTRVSKEAYQSWRTLIDFETAKAIQETGRCKEMMEHFGYLPVYSSSHLTNLSSSLVDQLPPLRNTQRYQL